MRERVLGSRTVFEGRFIGVRVDDVEAADGHRSTREVVSTRGAAAIVCVHRGDLVFVRQYRHAIGKILLEIPAGVVEDGESPEETAARELVEEVGLRPRKLERLARYFASPGFTNHSLDIFFTDDVEEAQSSFDEGEVIEIERRPASSVRELLADDTVTDSKTLLGLALYALRG